MEYSVYQFCVVGIGIVGVGIGIAIAACLGTPTFISEFERKESSKESSEESSESESSSEESSESSESDSSSEEEPNLKKIEDLDLDWLVNDTMEKHINKNQAEIDRIFYEEDNQRQTFSTRPTAYYSKEGGGYATNSELETTRNKFGIRTGNIFKPTS
uniref:Uncharacterized protein n=1 Tax=Marseillevirus LCMAC102 TaxID=2506603 RepID=A0A481YTH8_9VIRU|nr:MAG: hypothetical protein LCMAC102_02870 [Marseillevirus LCMAC102]